MKEKVILKRARKFLLISASTVIGLITLWVIIGSMIMLPVVKYLKNIGEFED